MELSSCFYIGKQSLPDVPPLDDEDDDCEEDEKENTKEENKIIACLPYHTSISVPTNRNFCDLTFRHGYNIGSLLADAASDDLRDRRCTLVGSECFMDNSEYSTGHNRDCMIGSTRSMVDHNKGGDYMGHSSVEDEAEHNAEHDMELTPDNAGPTVVEHNTEHTRRHNATEHTVEENVVEGTEDVTRHTKCDPWMSIDEYLQLCEKHLNFSEIDVMFAKYLYDTICAAGVMGVPQTHLEQVC